jgi:hypothetical protein
MNVGSLMNLLRLFTEFIARFDKQLYEFRLFSYLDAKMRIYYKKRIVILFHYRAYTVTLTSSTTLRYLEMFNAYDVMSKHRFKAQVCLKMHLNCRFIFAVTYHFDNHYIVMGRIYL